MTTAFARQVPGTYAPVAWGAYGFALALALWQAPRVGGAIALLALIALAFVLPRVIPTRDAWISVAVCGTLMAGVLGWAAATSARCPAGGERVVIKATKPAVSCAEFRASYTSMAVLFAGLAVGAAAWGRRRPTQTV